VLLEERIVQTQGVGLGDWIPDQSTKAFKRRDDIVGRHACALGDLGDADRPALLDELSTQNKAPVIPIGDETHIAKRFFRTAGLLLDTGEKVGEFDQELAVSFTLVDGEDEDAGDVIERTRSLLFREIAYKVAAEVVILRHNIKEERFDIVIESL
jgi:hypothetical protein